MTDTSGKKIVVSKGKKPELPIVAAPDLHYQPRDPKSYRPHIGLIGCGDITVDHLRAYSAAGYKVVALCDLEIERARERQQQFYPDAAVFSDHKKLLQRDDIEVVDIATHPAPRPPIIEAALLAGKHVLSQKPYVLDLDEGERLAELAEKQGVLLAVNQNGRWAPHFSYAREAVVEGLLGEISGAHLSVDWDHEWVKGTKFEAIKHLILYDYAIHWFDIVRCFFAGHQPLRVYASTAHSPTQVVKPAMLAQALIEFDSGQASLFFNANNKFGPQDHTYVGGSLGSINSRGPNENVQELTLTTARGIARPTLVGRWFPTGFHGAMGELLCAIEEKRQPSINAADNLHSLALCFAAIASAETRQPIVPGTVRQLPQ